jgi:tRNA G18 (ribose-2'-O)-methylase SpoU
LAAALRVTSRNARFQQWQSLLANRAKRQRSGEFIVQGVRPITLALRQHWPVSTLLYNADTVLSRWASGALDTAGAPAAALSAELMLELSGKDETAPELLAVARLPGDDLNRIAVSPGMLTIVFDRPSSPGNIGTLIRSADAFGAAGVIVTGHAADVYDPRSVRASTGSLFCLPVVRAASHRPVLDWVQAVRDGGTGLRVVGADEDGGAEVTGIDFTQPTLLVIGNETAGLSAAWQEACGELARIPMLGAASSLNAAAAAAILLYESARQRIAAGLRRPAAPRAGTGSRDRALPAGR